MFFFTHRQYYAQFLAIFQSFFTFDHFPDVGKMVFCLFAQFKSIVLCLFSITTTLVFPKTPRNSERLPLNERIFPHERQEKTIENKGMQNYFHKTAFFSSNSESICYCSFVAASATNHQPKHTP